LPNLIDKFLDTIAILFDPFLIILAAISFTVGVILRRKILFVLRLILCGLAALLLFLWMQYFVFPYPPNASSAKWMISGAEYTSAGAILANDQKYLGYSRSRRNGELVYASGGDPQNVWTGASIDQVTLIGKLASILLAFLIGTLPALKNQNEK
jgi:energy-coupling factor transporter transmembrane protein EcfT